MDRHAIHQGFDRVDPYGAPDLQPRGFAVSSLCIDLDGAQLRIPSRITWGIEMTCTNGHSSLPPSAKDC